MYKKEKLLHLFGLHSLSGASRNVASEVINDRPFLSIVGHLAKMTDMPGYWNENVIYIHCYLLPT